VRVAADDDGNVPGRLLRAQSLEHLLAAQVGEGQVEQDHAGAEPASEPDAVVTGGRRRDAPRSRPRAARWAVGIGAGRLPRARWPASRRGGFSGGRDRAANAARSAGARPLRGARPRVAGSGAAPRSTSRSRLRPRAATPATGEGPGAVGIRPRPMVRELAAGERYAPGNPKLHPARSGCRPGDRRDAEARSEPSSLRGARQPCVAFRHPRARGSSWWPRQ